MNMGKAAGQFKKNTFLVLFFTKFIFSRAAAPEGTGDLRSSVTNLLDAMQNLLGGLHLPELPQDADASEDSDDDADWQ